MPRIAALISSFYSWHVFLLGVNWPLLAILRRSGHVQRTVRTRQLLIRKHRSQLGLVRLIGDHALAELSLPRASLRGQDVAGIRVSANDFARAGLLEPFGRTLVCL